MLGTVTESRCQTDCDWSGSSCIDPWTYNPPIDLWVEVSSSPPCSVKVTARYNTRCNEVDVVDFDVYLWDANPTGCASPGTIANSIIAGLVKDAIYNAIANLRMNQIAANPLCCPCPLGTSIVISKFIQCHAIALSWTGGSGSQVTVEYDPTLQWSHYQFLIEQSYAFNQVPGSANPYFTMLDCLSLGCCFRTRSFCRNSESQIVFQDGPWQVVGPACNFNTTPKCTVLNCSN